MGMGSTGSWEGNLLGAESSAGRAEHGGEMGGCEQGGKEKPPRTLIPIKGGEEAALQAFLPPQPLVAHPQPRRAAPSVRLCCEHPWELCIHS